MKKNHWGFLGWLWLLGFLLAPSFGLARVAVPDILTSSDKQLYRQAFDAVRKKNFSSAHAILKKTTNPILQPFVLAKIYLHPSYKTTFQEANNWLKNYGDRSPARQIYKLAYAKRPNKKTVVFVPIRPEIPLAMLNDKSRAEVEASGRDLTDEEFAMNKLEVQVAGLRRKIARDQFSSALALVRQSANKDNIKTNPELIDRMYAITIGGFYFEKKFQEATAIAEEAINALGEEAIESGWWGGLSFWQRGQYQKATNFFQLATNSRDDFLQSAAYFWLGRSFATMGQEDEVDRQLMLAAQNPTTFYGRLAIRYLSPTKKLNNVIANNLPFSNGQLLKKLAGVPVFARGFALLEVDEPELAAWEWQYAGDKLTRAYSESLLVVASDYQLHHTGMRLALTLQKLSGQIYGNVLFPLPSQTNLNGWHPDDLALTMAVARQESHFLPYAISGSGAIGLMQMMPQTALMMSRHDDFRDLTAFYINNRTPSKYDLFNSDLNFTMGSRYLASLLKEPDIDGNLIFAVASYNAGPNRVRQWMEDKAMYQNDPLLFIESIRFRETRLYVPRVIANYWVYSDILDIDQPTLTELSLARWPKKFYSSNGR